MSGSEKQQPTSKPEAGQKPLPGFVVQVRTASGEWRSVEHVPTDGRFRLVQVKSQPDAK
jgi:hypothetical protein